MREKWSVFVVAALVVALLGCSPASGETQVDVDGMPPVPGPTASTDATARVLVTLDYGAETVLDTTVTLSEGMTAMQALSSVAEVGTAYGGGFVQSIGGMKASTADAREWFYNVNGVLANRGAAEYVLRDGDLEHWDYRQCGFRRNVSATLAAVPAFLLNGYRDRLRPAIVAFDEAYVSEAQLIAGMLVGRGVTAVSTFEIAEMSAETWQQSNVMLIAGAENPLVREIFDRPDRLGLFVQLESGGLWAYTAKGDEVRFTGSAGLLLPMQNPWNPSGIGACEAIVVLVSGTDDAAVKAAATLLAGAVDDIPAWCGAVVLDDGFQPLPLRDSRVP